MLCPHCPQLCRCPSLSLPATCRPRSCLSPTARNNFLPHLPACESALT